MALDLMKPSPKVSKFGAKTAQSPTDTSDFVFSSESAPMSMNISSIGAGTPRSSGFCIWMALAAITPGSRLSPSRTRLPAVTRGSMPPIVPK